jgi:hypothetical protein
VPANVTTIPVGVSGITGFLTAADDQDQVPSASERFKLGIELGDTMRCGTRIGDAHSLRCLDKLAKNHESIDSAKTDNSIAG